ncbi:hypothetical protein ACH42_12915 [Endozoicomonas sp. (ex Bugula neritina AB1)]|nr:hypothetical protein ACH42_12915 [Endozoicomonas sp. (ex Bugula neritina AB1)]
MMSNIMQFISNKVIQLLLLLLLTTFFSFLSKYLSEPDYSTISSEYVENYNSIANKMLSEEEFSALKKKENEFFEKLNSREVSSKALGEIVSMKLLMVPIFALLYGLLGFILNLQDRSLYLVAGIMAALIGVQFISILEMLIYMIFFTAGQLYKARSRHFHK